MPPPGPRSDIVVVTPEGWLSRGDAFVTGDGVQLSVFGGIPGERARVRIMGQRQRQDLGKWVGAVGRAHPDRVTPPCDRYIPCGHCPIMHLTPEGQDRARRQLVQDALVDAGIVHGVEPVVRGETTGIQYEVELLAGRSDRGRFRVGISGHDGRDVVAIPACPNTTAGIREVMKLAAFHLQDLDVWPWEGGRGTLRGLIVREDPVSHEIHVTLVSARPSPLLEEFAARLASAHPVVSGVTLHLNEEAGSLLDRKEDGDIGLQILYGKPVLDLHLPGLTLRLSTSDPFPENPAMEARITTALVASLGASAGDAVLDLGTGNGLRAMALAATTGWALGVDVREAWVRRARENAHLNGISAEFAIALDPARFEGLRPLVAVDAGTRGLDGADVDRVVALAPRRVALLGRNPRSVARAAREFIRRGLVLHQITPFDAAPNTPFVTLLAELRSTDTTPPARRSPRRRAVR